MKRKEKKRKKQKRKEKKGKEMKRNEKKGEESLRREGNQERKEGIHIYVTIKLKYPILSYPRQDHNLLESSSVDLFLQTSEVGSAAEDLMLMTRENQVCTCVQFSSVLHHF